MESSANSTSPPPPKKQCIHEWRVCEWGKTEGEYKGYGEDRYFEAPKKIVLKVFCIYCLTKKEL